MYFDRLKHFAKLYDTVRNERNKFVNLLHKAHQKVNEIRQRHKMSLNELEILRNSAVTQERYVLSQLLSHISRDADRSCGKQTKRQLCEHRDTCVQIPCLIDKVLFNIWT